MKKVLFATTALIATASVAAADVRISGYGRFGLDWNDNNSNKAGDPANNGTPETTLTSRLRIQFDMSTETDGGVGFNARVRMQAESRDNQNLSNGNQQLVAIAADAGLVALDPNGDPIYLDNDDNGFNGARFGVSYGGLLVNVGNIIGAVENTPGLYTTGTRSAGTGVDGMGFNSLVLKDGGWDAYSSDGQGVNGVEAIYSMGGFTGHISYSDRNDTDIDAVTFIGVEGESRVGIMLAYNWNDYYVAASYQDSSNGLTFEGTETNDLWMIAGGGSWGDFGARLAYGETGFTKAVTLEGSYTFGGGHNVLLWINRADSNKTAAGTNAIGIAAGTKMGTEGTSWGINYQYDLGGGATFVAGYVDSKNDLLQGIATNNGKQKQFQAGVYFSF